MEEWAPAGSVLREEDADCEGSAPPHQTGAGVSSLRRSGLDSVAWCSMQAPLEASWVAWSYEHVFLYFAEH